MTFQAVPDTAQFTLRHVGFSNQELLTSIFVRNTVFGWPATRLSSVGTTIGNAWRDNVMPLLDPTMLFDAVDAVDLGAEFGDQATVEYNTSGGASSERVSYALAALVQLTGAGGGPPRRGRMFIPGLVEGQVLGDSLTSAARTALITAIDAVNTGIVGGGDAWVIVSRFSKTENPTPPHKRTEGITNTVIARDVRFVLATQRDRRAGEGS